MPPKTTATAPSSAKQVGSISKKHAESMEFDDWNNSQTRVMAAVNAEKAIAEKEIANLEDLDNTDKNNAGPLQSYFDVMTQVTQIGRAQNTSRVAADTMLSVTEGLQYYQTLATQSLETLDIDTETQDKLDLVADKLDQIRTQTIIDLGQDGVMTNAQLKLLRQKQLKLEEQNQKLRSDLDMTYRVEDIDAQQIFTDIDKVNDAEAVKDALDALSKHCQVMEDKCRGDQLSLQSKDRRIAELEHQSSKDAQRIRDLEERLDTAEAQANALQMSLGTATSGISGAVSGAVDASNRATASEGEVARLQTLLAERTQRHKEQLAQERKESETRFVHEREARDAREKQLNDAIARLSDECRKAHFSFQDEINAHNSTKSALRVADAQRDAANTRALEFESSCRKRYEEAKEVHDRSKKELQTRIGSLETQLEEGLAKQGHESSQRILNLEKRLSEAKQASEAIDLNLRESTRMMARSNQDVEELRETRTRNEQAIAMLEREKEEAEKERDDLRTQVLKMENRVEQVEEEAAQLSAFLGEERAAVEELTDRVNNLQDELQSWELGSSAKGQDLMDEFEKLRAKY
ncbi:Myosin-3 [Didymella keratinophila]|nr:Myosin-3 [Didymella keratinophila]